MRGNNDLLSRLYYQQRRLIGASKQRSIAIITRVYLMYSRNSRLQASDVSKRIYTARHGHVNDNVSSRLASANPV